VEVEEPIKTADHPAVAVLKTAPVMAVKPTGEDVELAEVVTPPPAEVAPVEVAAAELPKTASELPLVALLGLLALGGALTLRLMQKRSV
jgi:LPXTG-motif cell wall-anchored protein